MYPAIIQSAFGMFSCKKLTDGSNTFSLAPHLDCDSDEAHVAQAVAAASLAVWGVGFPLLLAGLIHRLGNNAKYSFVIVSYGYKRHLQFWEAWECLKKFGILLIITFLRKTPELAVIILLLFLFFATVIFAKYEPFVSSLINKAHLACEFLTFAVLLSALLSTCEKCQKWTEEVNTKSIVIISFAACLLAGLKAILWLETGSTIFPGGRRQALWDRFLESRLDGRDHALVRIRKLSSSFSGAIVPMPATVQVTAPAHSASPDRAKVETAVAARAQAAREDSTSLHTLPAQLTNYGRIATPNKMHVKALSMATNSILADVDDGNELKMQLEQCARKLDALGDDVQLTNINHDLSVTSLIKIRVKILSLAAGILVDVDDGDRLKMQLAKCVRKLEMLAGDDDASPYADL